MVFKEELSVDVVPEELSADVVPVEFEGAKVIDTSVSGTTVFSYIA